MTMPRTARLPGIEGNSAGNTAVLRIPRGRTYHQLFMEYSGVTLAQMTEIRLVINGDVRSRYKGADFLDELDIFEGRDAASGVLTIDFDRYNMRAKDAEELTAIGTGAPNDPTPITSISLEVDIDGDATAPLFTFTARTTPAQPAGLIKAVKNFTYNPTGAGEYDIVDLPLGPVINRLVLQNADITRVQVERDDTIIFDRTKALNAVIQADGIRVPDSDWFVIDPTEFGNGSSGIVTGAVQSFNVKLYISSGGAVPLLVEYLDGVVA
jgi:hypothetical protein